MESNHDVEMLRAGNYPWSVKQRVMSRVGHLSNEALAEFFSSDYDGEPSILSWRICLNNNHPKSANCRRTSACWTSGALHNRVLLATPNGRSRIHPVIASYE